VSSWCCSRCTCCRFRVESRDDVPEGVGFVFLVVHVCDGAFTCSRRQGLVVCVLPSTVTATRDSARVHKSPALPAGKGLAMAATYTIHTDSEIVTGFAANHRKAALGLTKEIAGFGAPSSEGTVAEVKDRAKEFFELVARTDLSTLTALAGRGRGPAAKAARITIEQFAAQVMAKATAKVGKLRFAAVNGKMVAEFTTIVPATDLELLYAIDEVAGKLAATTAKFASHKEAGAWSDEFEAFIAPAAFGPAASALPKSAAARATLAALRELRADAVEQCADAVEQCAAQLATEATATVGKLRFAKLDGKMTAEFNDVIPSSDSDLVAAVDAVEAKLAALAPSAFSKSAAARATLAALRELRADATTALFVAAYGEELANADFTAFAKIKVVAKPTAGAHRPADVSEAQLEAFAAYLRANPARSRRF
jgi:hypothetical protein